MIQHGADVNAEYRNQSTPAIGLVNVQIDVVRLLLEHGADANTEDVADSTSDCVKVETLRGHTGIVGLSCQARDQKIAPEI